MRCGVSLCLLQVPLNPYHLAKVVAAGFEAEGTFPMVGL